jgi:divalent metal cation (Fe/Co/Zn/Cd) transporter
MKKLLNLALYLSIITIIYNIVEGSISIFFGIEDETLALLGFGVDSFVEVISGLGILHMVLRMKKSNVDSRDGFERTALKITGFAFYLLVTGLLAGSTLNIINNVKPDTTIVGIIVSILSILTMYILLNAKMDVGRKLNSDAIIADANCTKTCFYLSIILLISSGLYELFRIGYIDILGSLGIAYYAFKEGRESFQKSKSDNLSCCSNDGCKE